MDFIVYLATCRNVQEVALVALVALAVHSKDFQHGGCHILNPLVHSNLNNQAARADNNNTMLRVPKLNLPRLPCDLDSSAQIMMKYQKCDSQHAENLCCDQEMN